MSFWDSFFLSFWRAYFAAMRESQKAEREVTPDPDSDAVGRRAADAIARLPQANRHP